MRPASQRCFIHSCICLRILIISYLATFLGTNSFSVLIGRKAVNQSINQSINQGLLRGLYGSVRGLQGTIKGTSVIFITLIVSLMSAVCPYTPSTLLFIYMLKHGNVHNSTHNEPDSSINALARIIRLEVHKRPRRSRGVHGPRPRASGLGPRSSVSLLLILSHTHSFIHLHIYPQ